MLTTPKLSAWGYPSGNSLPKRQCKMFYTSPEKPYELAVLDGDDVIGYLNYDNILSEIQKLERG